MTAAHPDTIGQTMRLLAHSCSNHCVIQVGPLSSDAMFEVVEISDACFVHLLLQYAPSLSCQPDINLVNSEATVEAR